VEPFHRGYLHPTVDSIGSRGVTRGVSDSIYQSSSSHLDSQGGFQTTCDNSANTTFGSQVGTNPSKPTKSRLYSHVFVVPSSSDSWRLISDLKGLNTHINAPHFWMSTVNVVCTTLRQWTFKLRRVCLTRLNLAVISVLAIPFGLNSPIGIPLTI
jgi:hypothetical protein